MILSKIESKHWSRTHKCGVRMPESVSEVICIDAKNGNDLWWQARKDIDQSIDNVGQDIDGDADVVAQTISAVLGTGPCTNSFAGRSP